MKNKTENEIKKANTEKIHQLKEYLKGLETCGEYGMTKATPQKIAELKKQIKQLEKQNNTKRTIKTYQERKEEARQQAIIWQLESAEKCLSYAELSETTEHFTKLSRHYGLIKEFKENGII